MRNRNPTARLFGKTLILGLLLSGLALVSTSTPVAAEPPCSACVSSYAHCISCCFPGLGNERCQSRCERVLSKCLVFYGCV